MTRYKPYRSDNSAYTPATSTLPPQTPPPAAPDHHYDYIPAQVVGVRETSAAALASGSYSHLLDNNNNDKPEPTSVDKIPKKAADESDRQGAAKERGGARENPYVLGPSESAYVMGPGARARQDMYAVLPTAEEMQELRED